MFANFTMGNVNANIIMRVFTLIVVVVVVNGVRNRVVLQNVRVKVLFSL